MRVPRLTSAMQCEQKHTHRHTVPGYLDLELFDSVGTEHSIGRPFCTHDCKVNLPQIVRGKSCTDAYTKDTWPHKMTPQGF